MRTCILGNRFRRDPLENEEHVAGSSPKPALRDAHEVLAAKLSGGLASSERPATMRRSFTPALIGGVLDGVSHSRRGSAQAGRRRVHLFSFFCGKGGHLRASNALCGTSRPPVRPSPCSSAAQRADTAGYISLLPCPLIVDHGMTTLARLPSHHAAHSCARRRLLHHQVGQRRGLEQTPTRSASTEPTPRSSTVAPRLVGHPAGRGELSAADPRSTRGRSRTDDLSIRTCTLRRAVSRGRVETNACRM